MSSYIVRHLPEDLGDVVSLYKNVKKSPFSYTSKENESYLATKNEFIYVVERRIEDKDVFYYLAYRYRCSERFKKAGREKWLDQFEYKNTVKYGNDPELVLIDPPVLIEDSSFCSWYKKKTLGMCELPFEHEKKLKALLP